MEEVFDEAAKYSNGNYYSDNTIESSKYKINEINNYVPIIDGGDKKFIAQNFVDNELSGLYITDNFIWKSDSIKIVKQNDILSSYAHHLLPKAVAYSAGTIKLFMDETQKNQTEKLPFFKKNVGGLINSAVGQVINVATNIYSSYGASAGDNNATLNTQNNPIVDAASSIISYAATPPQAIQKITPNVIATEQTPVPSQTNITPIISPTNNQPSPVTPNLNTPIPSYSNPSYGGSISVPISDNQITSTTDNNTITTSSSTPVVSDTTSTTSTIDITTSTSSTVEIIPDSTPTSTEIAPTSTSNISSSTTSTVDTTTSTTSTVDIPTSTTSTVDVVTSTPPEPAPDVVINEIAWAGTSAFTPKDQYIELYNNTDQDILLFSKTDPKLSWKLLVGGKEIAFNKIINEVIPAHGFYLFETPDDRTVTDISADILHIGSFKSTGDDIKLVDNNGQLVDEVDASNGWFAGSDTNYTSMEKINPRTSGNKKENLQSNQGPRFTGGVDGGGDLILNGSPKQSNFGSIVLKLKQIETERTLKKSDYPYILGYYEIPVGKTLNIEPGVTIKTAYNNSKFEVKGTLNIQGAADNKVVVTSDTAAPKSWQGLMFYPGSVGNLSGLDMRFAGKLFFLDGSGQWGTPVSQAVRGDNATVTISDSVFSDNGDSTIYLKNSNATIQNSSFKNGQLAIENYDGNLTLKNITVENYSKDDGAIYVKNIWPQM
ncbi:MAG: Phospholipase D/competence protein ComEA helix-hairpin-helix protein, partial [uncultured bacterium]